MNQRKIKCLLVPLMCLLFGFVFSQDVNISGNVVNGSGLPLPGANILEKGTANGTISD